MKRIFFTLLAALGCSVAEASGMVEGNRLQMQINYSGDVSAKVICPRDKNKDCRIDVIFQGNKYRITQAMLGKDFQILPRELAISYDQNPHTSQFTIWFEVICDKYSELPSDNYICMALLGVDVEHGKLMDLRRIRRATKDDYSGRVSVDLSAVRLK
jgi:hypothetical protein